MYNVSTSLGIATILYYVITNTYFSGCSSVDVEHGVTMIIYHKVTVISNVDYNSNNINELVMRGREREREREIAK